MADTTSRRPGARVYRKPNWFRWSLTVATAALAGGAVWAGASDAVGSQRGPIVFLFLMFGALVGYGVGLGFELYLDGQYWGGASPTMSRLAPGVNWYAPIPYRPYLGAYYARYFVGSGQPDLDAVGGRAGVTIASTPRVAFGAGVAYERLLGCSLDCESFWPEMTFGFLF